MSEAPRLFDAAMIAQRLARAEAGAPATFLMERAAEDLADRLLPVTRRFSDVLDFFSPGPQGAEVLARLNGAARIARLSVTQALGGELADPDRIDPGAGRYDCVLSLLALHAFNDPPGALARARRALKPDGLFIAAVPGGDTLRELREAFFEAELETTGGVSPRVFPFADVRALGQLLQRAGFALPVADSETILVRYGSALGLLRDLRAMGATNTLAERSRRPLARRTLARLIEIYAERFSDPDGRVRATFEIIWLSGWSPHESQQKPLKPGSARMRLADALSQPEQSAGEKPER